MTALLDPPRTPPANSVTLVLQLEFGFGEGSTLSKLTIIGEFCHIRSEIGMDSLHQKFVVGRKLGLGL
jgi:hypothetical protein